MIIHILRNTDTKSEWDICNIKRVYKMTAIKSCTADLKEIVTEPSWVFVYNSDANKPFYDNIANAMLLRSEELITFKSFSRICYMDKDITITDPESLDMAMHNLMIELELSEV